MDIAPARTWAPKEHSYLDAYKRRMQKSLYIKPKVEVSKPDPRGYMETFDTQEPLFRPMKRCINPENGWENEWRSCRGSGEYEMEGRVVHLGNNGTIVTPSGEMWRRGKRYFIPTSGSWTEPPFKPSLRYLAQGMSDDQTWRPCIRVYKVARPHYFSPRPVRRRYLPQSNGYGDTYQRLTPSEAYSEVYSPRRVSNISAYKPEWLAFSSDGTPILKPQRKTVTMYFRRHPQLHLFPPDPPINRRPLSKKVAGYFKEHPQLQLFSADFRPDVPRSHPSYLSTTRYDPEGRIDHFEDGSLVLQGDCVPPRSLGFQHIPSHCPPYEEVRAIPNLAGDVIGVDVLESKPLHRLMSPRLAEKLPSPAPKGPSSQPVSNKRPNSPAVTAPTGQQKRPNTAQENLKPVSPAPPAEQQKRPQTVPVAPKPTKQAADQNKPPNEDVHSRFMTEYMRSFNTKNLPQRAKAALQPWLA